MSTPRLTEDDAKRPHRFGIVGAGEQELSAADDHREGIVELVAGPPRKLAQGLELAMPEPFLFVYRSVDAATRRRSGPGVPARRDRRPWPPRIPRLGGPPSRRAGLPRSAPSRSLQMWT